MLSWSSNRDFILILQATPIMIVCDERQKHKRGGKKEKRKKRHEIGIACGERNVNYTNPFVGTRHEVRLANVPVGVTIECHLMA